MGRPASGRRTPTSELASRISLSSPPRCRRPPAQTSDLFELRAHGAAYLRVAPATTGDWYTVRILRRPTAPVRIALAPSSVAVACPPLISIDVETWEAPRHVHVRLRKGKRVSEVVEIGHAVTSEDPLFDGAAVPRLQVHCFASASTNVLNFSTRAGDAAPLGLAKAGEGARSGFADVGIPEVISAEFAEAHALELERHSAALETSAVQRREYKAALAHLLEDKAAAAPPVEATDPDGTATGYVSSDDEGIPASDEAVGDYVALRLSKRHDERRANNNANCSVDLVAAGVGHVLFHTTGGHVYAAGDITQGQLGRGDKTGVSQALLSRVVFQDEPEEEEEEEEEVAKEVAKEDDNDDDGMLFLNGDTRVEEAKNKANLATPELFTRRVLIAQIACGAHHSAAVSQSGALYVWGDAANGKLGVETKGALTVAAPVRVDTFPTGGAFFQVRRVACGSAHTLCTAVFGDEREARLYAWGASSAGALGLGSGVQSTDGKVFLPTASNHTHTTTKEVMTPTEVEAIRGRDVAQLGCGFYHSAIVERDGTLSTCGLHDSGALGRRCLGEFVRDADAPAGTRAASVFAPVVVVARVSGKKKKKTTTTTTTKPCRCIAVACGGAHTVFLLSNRQVYACGENAMGQLGLGDTKMRRHPARVDLVSASRRVAGVACGPNHSGAWTDGGVCLVWGEATCGCGDLGASTGFVTVPTVVALASHARCKQLALGGTQAVAVTDLSLAAVRHVVASSRRFFNDGPTHFKTAESYRAEAKKGFLMHDATTTARRTRRCQSMGHGKAFSFVVDGGDDDDDDDEHAKRRETRIVAKSIASERRLWAKRYKLYKVVAAVEAEIFMNKRAQAKVVNAVQQAALARVLNVKPAHSYLKEKARLPPPVRRRPQSAVGRVISPTRTPGLSDSSDSSSEILFQCYFGGTAPAAMTTAVMNARPASARPASARRSPRVVFGASNQRNDDGTTTKTRKEAAARLLKDEVDSRNRATERALRASVLEASRADFADHIALEAQRSEVAAALRRGLLGVGDVEAKPPTRRAFLKHGSLPSTHPLRAAVGFIIAAAGLETVANLRCCSMATRCAFDLALVGHVEDLVAASKKKPPTTTLQNPRTTTTTTKLGQQAPARVEADGLDDVLADLARRTEALAATQDEDEDEDGLLLDDDDDDEDIDPAFSGSVAGAIKPKGMDDDDDNNEPPPKVRPTSAPPRRNLAVKKKADASNNTAAASMRRRPTSAPSSPAKRAQPRRKPPRRVTYDDRVPPVPEEVEEEEEEEVVVVVVEPPKRRRPQSAPSSPCPASEDPWPQHPIWGSSGPESAKQPVVVVLRGGGPRPPSAPNHRKTTRPQKPSQRKFKCFNFTDLVDLDTCRAAAVPSAADCVPHQRPRDHAGPTISGAPPPPRSASPVRGPPSNNNTFPRGYHHQHHHHHHHHARRPSSSSKKKPPPVDAAKHRAFRRTRAKALLNAAYTARPPLRVTEPVLATKLATNKHKRERTVDDCVEVLGRLKEIVKDHPIATPPEQHASPRRPAQQQQQQQQQQQEPEEDNDAAAAADDDDDDDGAQPAPAQSSPAADGDDDAHDDGTEVDEILEAPAQLSGDEFD